MRLRDMTGKTVAILSDATLKVKCTEEEGAWMLRALMRLGYGGCYTLTEVPDRVIGAILAVIVTKESEQ